MSKKRKLHIRRVITIFLLLTILNEIFAPTVAFALTAGPTAPEATSFEPVDTTQMVNPMTGNFTYNLPLLEVPGPEGGYPLSLAYHAGIQPNEEASWAGLGWSLNPGAITRNVNGYADDFSDVTQSNRQYWAGGSRSTLGISVQLANLVSFGLSFAEDTYQGFGVGAFVGYGAPIAGDLGVSAQVGVNPYGGFYASAGLSYGLQLGTGGLNGSASLGIQTNFSSIQGVASAGIGFGDNKNHASLLGISMSTGSSTPSFTIGGVQSSVYNQNAGKIQTQSSGWGISIPTFWGVSIGLSYNYTRYWSDETASTMTNGSLYFPQRYPDLDSIPGRAFDTYRLLDPKNYNIVDNPDPDQLQGGTFPGFDDYNVTAQGLGGAMRPYIYQSLLYGQDQTNLLFTSPPANGMKVVPGVQFRFENDFSNRHTQQPLTTSGLNFQFDTPNYGNGDGDYGYNTADNHLEGSKHIVWFTNSDINSLRAKAKGFIDTRSAGFTRMGNAGAISNTRGTLQIGGFMITNQSGVNYHYALPAYEKNEFSYTASQDDSRFTSDTRTEPYAYTWFLTAITGPDYVDTNNNGLADDGDWGYWVNFDYGEWADNYKWRNPEQGAHTDIDPQYKAYSQGTKEIYYLDAIKTRSHTALFVKEMRNDAKSIATGGSGFDNTSVASLGLNSILLLQNDQFTSTLTSIRSAHNTFGTYGTNVVDVNDIATLTENLTQKCLRKTLFTHDYSLCPGVTNSFPSGSGSNTTNLGKYSLLSVDFQGAGGVPATPPIQFQYDLDPNDRANQDVISVTSVPSNLQGNVRIGDDQKFTTGDIISFSSGGKIYYCTLLSTTDNLNFKALFLNSAPTAVSSNNTALRTKNPPYNKDAYDIWSMYKSDYIPLTNNETLSRITSKISNMNVDAWSLRSIATSVGAELTINYEGDTYSKSVLNRNKAMIVSSGTLNSDNTLDLVLSNPQSSDLAKFYLAGDKFDGVFAFHRKGTYSDGVVNEDNMTVATDAYQPSHVVSVTGNVVKITVDPAMVAALNVFADRSPNTLDSIILSFLTGNVRNFTTNISYGGGVRVKDVILDDLNGSVRKTSYNYNNLDFTTNARISSGVTSYEPTGLDYDQAVALMGANSVDTKNYHRYLYKDMNYLLGISRVVPGPGVMYQYVTIADSSILANGNRVPVEGQIAYQFRVFNAGMIGLTQYQYDKGATLYNKTLSIKDYTSQIGNLVRTIQYDVNGNKLKEVINHYLNDDIVNQDYDTQVQNYDQRLAAYNYQGLIQERYGDCWVNTGVPVANQIYRLTMSGKDEIPIIKTGSTQIDYKNGTTLNETDLAFDFYSGSITKTLTTDSYGNRFVTETVPAYRKYPAMGLKVSSVTNANMLTQEASEYTYAVDVNNTPIGVITASAQTWSNTIPVLDPNGVATTTGQSNIWRMEKSVNWMPTGTSANNVTPYSSFIDYFASGGSTNAAWKKTDQITQYNVYSNALEDNDINGTYMAKRFGYNNSKVLITGSPARYNELAYAGAEDALLSNGNFSSNITKGAGTILADSANSHTGVKSLMVPAGSNGFTYTVPVASLNPNHQNYSVSVWVKPTTAGVTQAQLYYQCGTGAVVTPAQTFTKVASLWYLMEMTVPASAITNGNLVVGCKNASTATLYFDDFRFQPTAAAANAYVYDAKTGGLTYVIGNNNLYTRYQYDGIGRLVRVYKEVIGKTNIPLIEGIAYNYGKFQAACPIITPPVPPVTSSVSTNSFVTSNVLDNEWKQEAPPNYSIAEDDGTTINAKQNAGVNGGRFAYFATATGSPVTGTLSFTAKGTGTIEIQLLATNNYSVQASKTFSLTSSFQNFSWTLPSLSPNVEMVAAIMVNGGNSSSQATVQFQNNLALNLSQLSLSTSYTRFRADQTSMIGNAEKDWYGWSDSYNAPRKKYLQHSAYGRMRFQTTATQIAIEYVRDFYDKRVVNLFAQTQTQNSKVFDGSGNIIAGTGSVNNYTQITGGQVYTISGLLTTSPTVVWYHSGTILGAPVALTNVATTGQPPLYQVTAPATATNMGLLVQNSGDNFTAYSNCMVQQGAIGTVTPLDGTIPSAYTPFTGYTPSHISGPAIFVNGVLYKYYQVEGNDAAKVVQFVSDVLPAGNKTVEVMMPGQGTYLPADPHMRRAGTYLRAVYFPGTTTTASPGSTVTPGSIVYIHDSILSGYNISSDAQNNVWMMMTQRNASYGFSGDIFSEGYAGRILYTDVATPALTTAFANKLASFGVDKYWFQIGVNDFGFNTPLPVFYAQYKSLIEQLKVLRPNAKIYIQSTGPQFYEGPNGEIISDDGLSSAGPAANDFRDVQRALATSHSYCEYVDFENLFSPTIANLADGIHPTDAANVLYANGIKNKSTLLGTVLPVTSLAFYRSTSRHLTYSVPGIYTITATGGKTSYMFTKLSGTLPAGLTFNSDGTITGTPMSVGSFPINVKCTDANSTSVTQTFTINVDLMPNIVVGPQHIINAQINTPYSKTFHGYYGYGPYTYSITNGTLPPGTTFNGATGVLSGTPTATGTSQFTITATDHYGFSGSSDYTLVTGTTTPVALTDTYTVSATVDSNNHLWLTGHLNDLYSQTLFAFIGAYFTPSGQTEEFLSGNLVNVPVGLKDGPAVDMGAMGLLPGTFSVRMNNGGIAPATIDGVNIGFNVNTSQSLSTSVSSPTEQLTVNATINSSGHLIIAANIPAAPSLEIFTSIGAIVTQGGNSNFVSGPAVNIMPGTLTSGGIDFGVVPGVSGAMTVQVVIGAVSPTSVDGKVVTYNSTTNFNLVKP